MTKPKRRPSAKGKRHGRVPLPIVASGATWGGGSFKPEHIDAAFQIALSSGQSASGSVPECTSDDAAHVNNAFLFHAALLDAQFQDANRRNLLWLKAVEKCAANLCELLDSKPGARTHVTHEQKRIFLSLLMQMAPDLPEAAETYLLNKVDPRNSTGLYAALLADVGAIGKVRKLNIFDAMARAHYAIQFVLASAKAVRQAVKPKRGRPQSVADNFLLKRLIEVFEQKTGQVVTRSVASEPGNQVERGPFIFFVRALVDMFIEPRGNVTAGETHAGQETNPPGIIACPEIDGLEPEVWLRHIRELARHGNALGALVRRIKSAKAKARS